MLDPEERRISINNEKIKEDSEFWKKKMQSGDDRFCIKRKCNMIVMSMIISDSLQF